MCLVAERAHSRILFISFVKNLTYCFEASWCETTMELSNVLNSLYGYCVKR